jgi:hypothetical protein
MGIINRAMEMRDAALAGLQHILGENEGPKARAVLNALAADEAEAARRERVELVRQLHEARAQLTALYSSYEPIRLADAEAVTDARRALAAALAAQQRHASEYRRSMFAPDRAQERAMSLLQQSPPTQLVAFRAWLRDEVSRTCSQSDSVKERCIDGHYRVTWDNNASLFRRLDAINSTIRVLDDVALEALDEAALDARIAALRDQLPEIEPRPARYFRDEPLGAYA